jgi:hypothetical protein
VGGDREEPNRILGFPLPSKRDPGQAGRREQDGVPEPEWRGEPQRVLGFSADWLGQIGRILRRQRGEPK